MSSETTYAIKSFSTDREQSNSLLALMDYYKVNNLHDITEYMGLKFLRKLQEGSIRIPKEILTLEDLQ